MGSPGQSNAGVAYEVAPNLTLDFGYRYTDLGDDYSGKLINAATGTVIPGVDFEVLTSHDFLFSVRYQCCGTDAPIIPAYQPWK